MEILQGSKVGRLSDYLSTPADEVEVPQGGWRHGIGKMSTFSVASCVVVAAHNETTKRGLLGHFSTISPSAASDPQLSREQSDTNSFHLAVDYLPELGPLSSTAIWLGGAALSKVGLSSIKADRQYAVDKIYGLFPKYELESTVVTLDWNTTKYHLYIRLDCESGELLVQPVADET